MSAPLLLEFSAIDLPSQGKITMYIHVHGLSLSIFAHTRTGERGMESRIGVGWGTAGVFSQIAATGGGKSDGSPERERERREESCREGEVIIFFKTLPR